LQDAGGKAGLLEDPRDRDAAGDGRARIGLEAHSVAQRERRRHGTDAEDEGNVERRDHGDHTRGDPAGHRQPRLLARKELT